MKCPLNRPSARWLLRFPGRAVQILLVVSFWFTLIHASLPASAQSPAAEEKNTRSITGQFIILRPEQTLPSSRSLQLTATNKALRLEPALLAVSAERIRELLWQKLGIKGPWRGQIYLVLRPARSLDENVFIQSQPVTRGWNYRVELPDVLPPTRFARAMVGVLLLEFANRNAAGNSAEVPPWLVDGLSQQWLAAGASEFLLAPPDKLENGLPVTRLEKTRRGVDPLAGARRILKQHPALTFEELSWPTGAQLAGEDEGVYRASAQLFVSEICELKDGPARLRALLEALPKFHNWQVAFQNVFRAEFPRPLDLEKWWALQVVNFAARDPGPVWTVAASRAKLAEILRVPVAVRTASNSLPSHAEISLQAVIRNLEPAQQNQLLWVKLRDLDLAQLRVARPYAVLTAEYRRTLRSYLGDRPANASGPTWAGRIYASLKNSSAATTIQRLDALDARRRSIEAATSVNQSVQPSLAPLKF